MRGTHTEHGVELRWDEVEATKRTHKVVLSGPNCVIEVWLSAERVQHSNHTSEMRKKKTLRLQTTISQHTAFHQLRYQNKCTTRL